MLAFHQLLGGFYDAVAILLLLFAMAARRPAVAGAALFAAAWTDERALLAAPLVCLFALAQSERPRCIAVLSGAAAYLGSRMWLANAWALHTTMAGVGIPIFLRDLHMAPLGLWAGLTGSLDCDCVRACDPGGPPAVFRIRRPGVSASHY